MPTSFRTLGLALLGAVLLVLTCSDNPTKHKPMQPGHYPFYFNDRVNQSFIYRFDPVADSLDTIVLSTALWGSLAVSPDGARLYVGDHTQTGVFDTSGELLAMLPYPSYWGIAASADGELLALTDQDLVILRTSDYSVAYQDTTYIRRPSFAPGSTMLLGVEGGGGLYAYLARLGDSLDIERKFFASPAHDIKASPDGQLWGVYLRLGRAASLVTLYDPQVDTVLVDVRTEPGLGMLCFTPDGRQVVYSSPGDYLSTPPGDTLCLLGIEGSYEKTCFPTSAQIDQNDSLYHFVAFDNLAVSPDGRHLAGVHRGSTGQFGIYNLSTLEPVAFFNLDQPEGGSRTRDVACQQNK